MPTILVLAANPSDTRRLRLDREIRDIEAGLRRSRHREAFELRSVLAPRARDLRRAILDHEPTVLHFCGYGAGDAGIVLDDDDGRAQPMAPADLAAFLGLFEETVECVFLNACYATPLAEALAWRIEVVVGMEGEVNDATASEFAVAFYDALGAGKTYGQAFDIARVAPPLAGLAGAALPRLHRRPGVDDRGPSIEVRPRQEIQGAVRRRWWVMFSMTALLLAMTAVRVWDGSTGGGAPPVEETSPEERRLEILDLILQLRQSEDPTARRYVGERLEGHGAEAVPELLRAIRDEVGTTTDAMTEQAITSSLRFDLGGLFASLLSGQDPWREGFLGSAVEVLGNIGEPTVTPILEALEEDSEKRDRIRERVAALQAGGQGTIFDLLPLLGESQRLGMAFWTFTSVLVDVGRPAVPRLLDALDAPQPLVRLAAVQALVALGEPRDEIARGLRNLGNDPDDEVRMAAARALAALDSEKSRAEAPVNVEAPEVGAGSPGDP
ncbi:MAG: HEAT repeat domain-containing protein [Acidobacteriota bacterium]